MKTRGFTLIELLIVVAIIAILAAIAIPNFLEAQMRSRIIKTIANMKTCHDAIQIYVVDNNQLPMAKDTYVYTDFTWMIDHLMIEGDRRTHMGIPLTTPVAYLSSIPYDPFNSHYGGSFTSRLKRMSFVFSGVPKGGELLRVWENQQAFAPFMGVARWTFLMESAGPDYVWHNNSLEGWFYDPTNGTISCGQIVLFEGPAVYPSI